MNDLVQDPVCGMQVDAGQYATEYLGGHYAFCSLQCQERFLANPHLYIGLPGQKALKQLGKEVLKKRRLRLTEALAANRADKVMESLHTMMGIKSVLIEGVNIEIVYDLLQVTVEQIESKLSEIGVQLGEGWAERLTRAFVRYEEELEVGSLEVRKEKNSHSH